MSTATAAETEALFLKQVRDVLDSSGKNREAAVEFISKLHFADVDPLTARLDACEEETRHALGLATQNHHLLDSVLGSVTREVLRAAQLQARCDLMAKQLGTFGALARQSENGTVDAQMIVDTLRQPIPRIPFRPHIAAFHPSQQYRYGHFASDDGVVIQVFPFAGWSLVIHERDTPADRLQPTFLVDQELFPAYTLRLDRGIELQKLT